MAEGNLIKFSIVSLYQSSEEAIMDTWTSQTWNGTKVLKQLTQGKPL